MFLTNLEKLEIVDLTYQGADNPDPTYYQKFPSYETSLYDSAGNWTPDFDEAEQEKSCFS